MDYDVRFIVRDDDDDDGDDDDDNNNEMEKQSNAWAVHKKYG
jgi:hypothetical protein